MPRLSSASLLALALSLPGCEAARETGPTPTIEEGKAAVAELISVMGRSDDLARMEMILSQPDFSGVLREWGCLAVFDETGRLTQALTLKVVDFSTGARHPVREYTEAELDEAREQVLAFRETLGIDPSIVIPIFSHSFRLAVATAAANDNTDIVHALGRGSGDTAEQMQVIEIAGRSQSVIAADALYLVRRE